MKRASACADGVAPPAPDVPASPAAPPGSAVPPNPASPPCPPLARAPAAPASPAAPAPPIPAAAGGPPAAFPPEPDPELDAPAPANPASPVVPARALPDSPPQPDTDGATASVEASATKEHVRHPTCRLRRTTSPRPVMFKLPPIAAHSALLLPRHGAECTNRSRDRLGDPRASPGGPQAQSSRSRRGGVSEPSRTSLLLRADTGRAPRKSEASGSRQAGTSLSRWAAHEVRCRQVQLSIFQHLATASGAGPTNTCSGVTRSLA